MKPVMAQTAAGFRNILFATDFSPAAAGAIPYVKQIAKHYEAKVVAAYVRPPAVNPMTPPETWTYDLELEKEQNEHDRKELLAAFAGIPTEVIIEEGSVPERLRDIITSQHIDLVVLGTRGRTGLGKLLLGSMAEEIFRTVSCPVLTVGPQARLPHQGDGEIREILFATDLTSESGVTAAQAIALAQEFQARLVMMHVIPEREPAETELESRVKTSLRGMLEKLVPEEAKAWCKPEFFVALGEPAEKILDMACLRGSDLIVLGAKCEEIVPGAATHLPMATAHKVVSHARCPVLTIKR